MTNVLGKYQLIAEIARGGMGIVHLAVMRGPARFSKLLVIKELKPELAEEQTYLEMFLEEARLAGRLNHPNIVQTYEVGNDGKRHYIVMDYLEGVPLARVVRKKRSDKFTLAMHLRVICETLRGLSYAHTLADFDGTPLGIVHRDATPQNVFITYDGQVKLVDFGIARAVDTSIETQAGMLKGKPGYMAPEQIAGEVDARADVYAAAVMLWEAIVGRRMWHKKNDVEVLTSVFKGETPSLREAKPDVDEALLRICEKGLAKNREERFESAQALANAIEAYMAAQNWNPSMREVGTVAAELFAQERGAARATIDAQLQALRAGWSQDEKLPIILPVREDLVTPSSGAPHGFDLGSSVPASVPLLTGSITAPTPGGAFFSVPATETPKGHTRWRTIALGVLGVTLVLSGFVIARFTGRSEPPAAATPPHENSDAAPAPPPTATEANTATAPSTPPPAVARDDQITHEIRVSANPAWASIAFNGVSYANPATSICKHSDVLILRVNANGYFAQERRVDCDADAVIEIALNPLLQHGQTGAGRAAAPPPPVIAVSAAPPPTSSTEGCDPPYYFEGDKKVFKSGCPSDR
ncbi:MAG: serine/threonine protein kinase [Polyangiaceae bacterium]|nr:serine/threonine protein kinase [Polyangiaceae bacterium]